MTDKKTVNIPYVPQLDTLDNAEDVAALLDRCGVRRTIGTLNWPAQYPYKPLTTFTAANSGTHLYIDFFVRCNYLRAENSANQSPVSQDSCVEFFVDPLCDGHYWNFEFNCIGAVNASHRRERADKTPLTDAELDTIRRYASAGTRPFRELEGMFAWNLLVAIPLSLIGVQYSPDRAVAMAGNFYKCASATSAPHYLSWSPIDAPKPDFHRPEFFGTVVLDAAAQE